MKLNGFDPAQLGNDRQQFAIKNLAYRINQRLLDINQKFRSTFCKDIRAREELYLVESIRVEEKAGEGSRLFDDFPF